MASGIDEYRKSLDMVDGREISAVIIGFKDLERYFSHNVRVEVVNGGEPKDAYQELCWEALWNGKP